MPNYRRAFVPGGTFFFTVVTHQRQPILADDPARRLLGSLIRRCQMKWSFKINAVVLLPDHLHTIWTLPRGDSGYSRRWGWLKKEFTKNWLTIGGVETVVSAARRRERRRGVWQPRFYEHTIQDEDDFEIRFDYIHYNPVKHRLVRCPKDWQWTSFHRWVDCGVYPRNWACGHSAPSFKHIEDSVGESEDS